MKQWLTDNAFLILTTFVGPVVAWAVTKRHFQDRELSILDASVMEKNLQLYQDMLDDVVARKNAEIQELELENKELKTENNLLKK